MQRRSGARHRRPPPSRARQARQCAVPARPSRQGLASYDVALAPNDASTLNNLGYALSALGALDDALASYQAALACKPDYVEALVNCGNVLAALDRNDAADAHYDKAFALAPGLAEAQWNKSLLYLSHGRFAQGWALCR